jgi:hypothetical protein
VACKLYQALVEKRKSVEQYHQDTMTSSVGWAKTLPWLLYPSDSSPQFLDSDDVDTELLFRGGELSEGQASQLTFVAAVYSLNGEFRGLEIIIDQLQVLCLYCCVMKSYEKL